ncbi:hypothetical protein P3T73_05675 [Kiritimatiellota bacterium B12222]|nr:hypothetical protein P3T73_05675 [Kiritimatiellota bacterium B12222]
MRGRSGAVFLPWLFILLMVGSLIWLLNRLTTGLQHADTCTEHLLQVYDYLKLYERDNGRLPVLELYPEDLEGNPESILNRLSELPDFDPEWLICPASAEILRAHGTTYLWNIALNQSSLTHRQEITWVLVDIQALDDRTPGPHFGAYHILYTDGRVERSSSPPHSLPVQY